MRRVGGTFAGLSDRGRSLLLREWHSVVLTAGVAVLVPVFAVSVLALPPSTVERITSPVLGSTLIDAQLPALDSPRQRTSPEEAGDVERAEATSERPGRYTAEAGSPFSDDTTPDDLSTGEATVALRDARTPETPTAFDAPSGTDEPQAVAPDDTPPTSEDTANDPGETGTGPGDDGRTGGEAADPGSSSDTRVDGGDGTDPDSGSEGATGPQVDAGSADEVPVDEGEHGSSTGGDDATGDEGDGTGSSVGGDVGGDGEVGGKSDGGQGDGNGQASGATDGNDDGNEQGDNGNDQGNGTTNDSNAGGLGNANGQHGTQGDGNGQGNNGNGNGNGDDSTPTPAPPPGDDVSGRKGGRRRKQRSGR